MHFIILSLNFLINIISKIWFLLFNHLINVPLTLILGAGKYFAFLLAVIINQIQIFIYYKILDDAKLSQKFHWLINKKISINSEKLLKLSNEKRYSKYLTIVFLALLPVYFGGMFFAVFYTHSLKMNRTKSYIALTLGSILGCAFWTIGLVSVSEFLLKVLKII
ncbi:MAG: hypothetical protein SNJ64_01110 [Endomicrobiia bacterium]